MAIEGTIQEARAGEAGARAPVISGRRSTAMWLTAYASGLASAISWVFLIAMFASFAVGATSPGITFGRINDVLVIVWALLALPLVVLFYELLRPLAPNLSRLALTIGIGAMVAIIVLQSLLVVDALTFEEQVLPVSIAFLVLAAWYVVTGYLGSSRGALPHGVRMGLLAATSIGYPIWAFWLGGHLRSRGCRAGAVSS